MPAAYDRQLLDLCLTKNLVDRHTAATVELQAQNEGRPVSEVLVRSGVLAAPTVVALEHEIGQDLSGTIIAGFQILRKLGQGGMGTVYLAEQTSLRRQVALKVIAPQFSSDAQAVDRFMREARTAAAVNHPNIISVIDVGYDQGHLYMALELVTGGDAAQLAARFGGILPEVRALEIIADGCRGLQALYEARLIHRDIKPANIFLTKEGVAKLADLGLARTEQGSDRLTVSGHAVGTPAFMSPEQASGTTTVDIRSDVYALGATLFALVTGTPPFTGNGVFAIAAKLLTEPAPDPRTFTPGLSDATCRVIARCLAKSPAERFPSPQELLVAVSAALAGAALSNSVRPLSTAKSAAKLCQPTPTTAAPRRPRTLPAKRSKVSPPWAAIGLVIAVAAIAFIAWTMGTTRTPHKPATEPGQPTVAERATQTQQQPAQAVVADMVVVPKAAVPAPAPAMPVPVSTPDIPGLIGHWPLDEGSGAQVRDHAGISEPGEIVDATWTSGRIGGALSFKPPSKVLLGNAPRLLPTRELTVMFWIKAPPNTVTHEPVSVVRHDRHFTALQLTHEGVAHCVSWAGDHVNLGIFPWRDVWDDEEWHHYAVTYHLDLGMHIFRDGALHFSNPELRGPLPSTTAEPFILGASEQGGEYFTGALDDLRVYSRVLTAKEIATIVAAAQ